LIYILLNCSVDVLAKGGLLPAHVNERLTDLYNTYYPVEVDPHKTIEEKQPVMVKWLVVLMVHVNVSD